MCHCDECRRGVAAAFSAVMGLSVEDLTIEGDWQDYRYTAESSRGFCPHCGTRLWFKSDLWSDEVFMNVGALDDPSIYVPDRHVVMDEKVPWAHPADGFEGHEGFSVAPEVAT